MTARFRAQRENILKTEFQGQNVLAICETYDRSAFDTILAKSECRAVRIYYGMDENLRIHAIIVAVDADDEDIIPVSSLTSIIEEGDIIDNANRCPDLCPPSSELNS